ADIYGPSQPTMLGISGRPESEDGKTLEPLTGPTPAFGGLTQLENGWLFTAPEKIVIGPEVLSNGIINLVGESATVYRLNPDGSAREVLTLPEFTYDPESFYTPLSFYDDGTITVRTLDKLYAVNPDGTMRWEIPITLSAEGPYLPETTLGDLFLQLDSTNTLHAYTLADGERWQYPFANGFREDFFAPAVDETHAYYVDSAGIVYAFTREGLTWNYTPEERLKAASAPILTPDGNLYYVLTNNSKGFLQALTLTGEPRWQTELTTFSFYTLPDYSVGAQYIFVKDNLVRADTGELAPFEFPYEVDAFIRGEDGFDYLLTGDNVIRWQVGPAGFESLHTSRFNAEGLSTFSDPRVRVYPSQITEMEYFTQNGPYMVWLNPDGELMNAFALDWNAVRLNLQQEGETSLTQCQQSLIEEILECQKYVAGTQDPVWETVVEGISGSFNPFFGLVIQNGQIYILTDEVNLYVLALEIP
ncbi:MAG: PQQ-binding-like beta-propeller repeat protein, partial [Anaerolineales bacterium]|nr:PQQ-binding-like beta-propeller repeat protein [Anaerolineales bacterium]